ncbi:MAG: lactate utilization protein [Nitrospirae bacterium]|nr:lactate utilization protein [Nitrospirota bacterium]
MKGIEKAYFRRNIPRVLDELRKKQYDPHFFETIAEAKHFILDQISSGDTVGVGGSITLREGMGIVEEIRNKGNKVYDHWEADDEPVRRLELKRKHRGVDVFLSGINAITIDGILVNLDGGGNRVAGLCSGPPKVIAVTGLNKLVDSLDEAIERTRNKAAVLNAIRRKVKTPCVKTGRCSDCNSSERICAALLILLKKTSDIDHFFVVLINEEMGY